MIRKSIAAKAKPAKPAKKVGLRAKIAAKAKPTSKPAKATSKTAQVEVAEKRSGYVPRLEDLPNGFTHDPDHPFVPGDFGSSRTTVTAQGVIAYMPTPFRAEELGAAWNNGMDWVKGGEQPLSDFARQLYSPLKKGEVESLKDALAQRLPVSCVTTFDLDKSGLNARNVTRVFFAIDATSTGHREECLKKALALRKKAGTDYALLVNVTAGKVKNIETTLAKMGVE